MTQKKRRRGEASGSVPQRGTRRGRGRLATHIRRRCKLDSSIDRVLLFEHGFHFGQLTGLEADKLGMFVTDTDRVSGREGQKHVTLRLQNPPRGLVRVWRLIDYRAKASKGGSRRQCLAFVALLVGRRTSYMETYQSAVCRLAKSERGSESNQRVRWGAGALPRASAFPSLANLRHIFRTSPSVARWTAETHAAL